MNSLESDHAKNYSLSNLGPRWLQQPVNLCPVWSTSHSCVHKVDLTTGQDKRSRLQTFSQNICKTYVVPEYLHLLKFDPKVSCAKIV